MNHREAVILNTAVSYNTTSYKFPQCSDHIPSGLFYKRSIRGNCDNHHQKPNRFWKRSSFRKWSKTESL